ncbi:hypothetical protein NBRC116493_13600 [Aurantivibrio infirmus]
MKKLFKIALAVLLLQPFLALGHGDQEHEHEQEAQQITIVEAQRKGLKVTQVFAQADPGLGFGKLSDSWSSLTIEDTKLHHSGAGYHIVAVTNTAEGKTLYILMSKTGDLYDANFTGEFPNLKS